MKIEIQNQLIDALRILSSIFGLEDHCTLGLALVRGSIEGLGKSHPEIQTAGVMLGGKMLGDPRFAEALIQKHGLTRVDKKTLRLELDGLTDGQGIRLRDEVLEINRTGSAMIGRAMKSYC